MKNLLILSLFISFAFEYTYSNVLDHSEDSLNQDLSFTLDDDQKSARDVASENENNDETEEKERDIASELDEGSSTIKYWKY
jgi:hypothetical protein